MKIDCRRSLHEKLITHIYTPSTRVTIFDAQVDISDHEMSVLYSQCGDDVAPGIFIWDLCDSASSVHVLRVLECGKSALNWLKMSAVTSYVVTDACCILCTFHLGEVISTTYTWHNE